MAGLDKIKGLLADAYDNGAPYRKGLMGLLSGDTGTINSLVNQVKQLGDPSYMRNIKSTATADGRDLAMLALTTGGNVAKAIPKTPYELAHELAQKNAIEMLGLPANNTAMDRAKALGFDTPAYHGTNADFNSFSVEGRGKTSGSGAFFTDNPSVADTYTMGINNGNTLPVLLKQSDTVVVDANGKNWNRLDKKTKVTAPKIQYKDDEIESLLAELEGRSLQDSPVITKKQFSKNLGKLFPDEFRWDDYFSTDDLARWANKEGYGNVNFKNVIDRGGSGVMHTANSDLPSSNYAMFNPANIRSRFAAFDPARAHEADLLGYSTPEMLGLLALGSAGGVGYMANNKAKK